MSILLACCTMLGYLAFVAGDVGAPYSLDYGEGVVWWQSVHIDDFRLVYKPLTSYPYMVTHYPPVYHWVTRWATGVIPDWLLAGRLVSVLSALGVAFILGGLVCRASPGTVPQLWRLASGMLTAGLVLGAYPVACWSRYARVDLLALLCLYAGLACFILSEKSEAGQRVAFVFFVLAVYTKQTTVFASLVCLGIAWREDWRRALRLAVFALVVAAIPLTWLMWATRGGFFLNILGYNGNPWQIGRFATFLRNQALLAAPILLAAAAAIFWAGRLPGGDEWRTVRRSAGVLGLHWLTAWILALGAGKIGSNINYFLELDATSCALAGLLVLVWFGTCQRWAWLAPPLQASCLAAVLVLAFPTAKKDADRRARARDYAVLLDAVKAEPGVAFAEDVSLLMKAGKEPPAEAAITAALARTGAWDETPLVAGFARQQVGTLVIEKLSEPDFYTPAVAAAIRHAYRPVLATSLGTIYRPRR